MGGIHLLPALPDAWPSGSLKGLRVRGALTIDLAWKDGKLIEAFLTADRDGFYQVRYGSTVKQVDLKAGRRTAMDWSGS